MPPSASGLVERTVPSVRRQSGHGEDLFGRQVRDVEDPALRLAAAAEPMRAGGMEADRQVGAGAA